MQQREGRIIRQGNENPKVDIYTYVTENTFDSYLYQLVEGKQKFIGQIMTSKSPVRSAEDIDETALSYAEIKALCSGNPHIKEKMDLDIEVQKLKLLRSNHMSQRFALEDQLIRKFPKEIASMHQWIDGLEADMALLKDKTQPNADGFCSMVIDGQTYTEKKAAGTAILDACNALTSADPVPLGSYRGFKLTLCFDSFEKLFKISMQGTLTYKVGLGTDVFGNIQRMDNLRNPFIPYPKAKGIHALYLRYCYELCIIQKHPASVKRVPYSMRQDLILLDKLDAETHFLAKHKYGTAAELESHKKKSTGRISDLEQERNTLRNQLRAATRREDAPAVESLKSRIKEVSSEIKTLRQEVKLCDGIEARSALMERNLEQLQQEQEIERKEEEQHELFRRGGRSGRPAEFERR